MKIILQRVKKSNVIVNGKTVGTINRGFNILLGVSDEDTEETVRKAVDKISKLRVFEDENDKINLSINDIGGDILVISQFTLYGNCVKGNRPSFIEAGKPDHANKLYDYFIEYAQNKFKKVESGVFGADMEVNIINDGPFTLILEY